MNSLWITAWTISFVSAGLAACCARRAGTGWTESLIFAVPFFPAPLFVAIGGGNSFVYLLDFIVPVTVFVTCRRWNRIPAPARKAALWIVAGAGVTPFLVCAGFAERNDLLFAAINLYRLVGAMSLLCLMSAATLHRPSNGEQFLSAFSLINVVLVAAMLLQGYGIIDSNVFYAVSGETAAAHEQVRFIAAGLFRGSLGIIGAFGIIAYLARGPGIGPFHITTTAVSIAGAIAGTSIITLSGSKSSLVSVLFLLGACGLFRRWIYQFWMKAAALVIVGLALCIVFFPKLEDAYLSHTLGTLSLQEESLQTLSGRQQTWREGLDLINDSPSILVGFPTSKVEDLNTACYHNEFIGLLMVGGIFSLGAYLIGILLLGRWLFQHPTVALSPRTFAALAWLAGLVHALTVNHLTPGILYSSTVSLFACAYGLGLNASFTARRATAGPVVPTNDPLRRPNEGLMPQPVLAAQQFTF